MKKIVRRGYVARDKDSVNEINLFLLKPEFINHPSNKKWSYYENKVVDNRLSLGEKGIIKKGTMQRVKITITPY